MSNTASSSKLNIALWVAQAILAAMFGMAGVMKIMTPIDELARKAPWVADMPGLVRFIGISELAGAAGLILPAATRILPGLTPLASAGLVVIMVLATAYHFSRGEMQSLPVTIGLGGLALFVAWGRFRKAPIAPKS